MKLFVEMIDSQVPDMHERGARVRFVGRREGVPAELVRKIEEAEALTHANTKMTLYIAFNYGGRATSSLRRGPGAGGRRARAGGEPARHRRLFGDDDLRRHLYAPEMHDPELLIRTSRRAAHQQLPAVAVRLLGALLQRQAVARLLGSRPGRGAGRVRRAPAPLRGPQPVTTRIITGVVLGVVALLVVVHGGLVFFVLMLALAVLALNEFYRLTRLYKPLALPGFAGLLAPCCAWPGSPAPTACWAAWPLPLCFAALGGFLIGPKPGVTARVAVTLLGAVYVGLGFSCLLLLRRIGLPGHPGAEGGAWLVGMTVFGAWGGDTMAYFIGKWFGHTPMAPSLSPKKTWEGFAGGALGTILLVVFIGFMMGYQATGWSAGDGLVLGLVIAVTGPLGDLFESLVKRDVQIKDSGRGLPGHGGVLDRFDALLWAAVAAYFLVSAVLGF